MSGTGFGAGSIKGQTMWGRIHLWSVDSVGEGGTNLVGLCRGRSWTEGVGDKPRVSRTASRGWGMDHASVGLHPGGGGLTTRQLDCNFFIPYQIECIRFLRKLQVP